MPDVQPSVRLFNARIRPLHLTVRTKRAAILCAALAACGTANLAHAQISGTWSVDAAGSWSNAANWTSNPSYPDAGGIAVLGPQNTVARAITLDVPVTLSELNDVSSKGYSIAVTVPASTLTFTGAAVVRVTQGAGTLLLSAPIVVPTGSSLTTLSAGSLWVNSSISGALIVNNSGGAAARTDLFNTVTGPVTVNGGTLDLNSPGSNPGTGDGRIAGTAGVTLNNGSLQFVNSNKTLSDRIDPNNPITMSSATIQFNGPATNGGTLGVNETLGTITLNNGFGALGSVSPAFDRLSRITLSGLTRNGNSVLLVRGTNLGQNGAYAAPSGTTASSFFKIGNSATEQALVASEVGDPATTYSATATNLPIVPWVIADSNQNQGSFNSFASYIVDNAGNGPGFVTLQAGNFINAVSDGTVTTNNVRLTNAAGSPIALTTPSTINSLLLTTDGGITGAGALTITSGLVGASGVTNAVIANDVRFGAANDREAIIPVSSGSLTFSGAISTSGGLTKVGGGNLVLAGSNTYTGRTSLYGTNGNGTVTIAGDANLGTPPATPTPDSLVISGQALNITAATTINPNRGITLLGNATFAVASTVTYNGTMTDNSAGRTLTKTGTGRLILGGSANSIGSVTILSGAISLGATNALGPNPNLQIGFTSTGINKTLDLANDPTAPTAAFDQTVASLSVFAGDTTPQNDIITNSYTAALGATSPATLTVNNATANTFPGVIAGNLNLMKSNAGTLTLTGTNTYTGLTTVNKGALVLGNGAQAPVLSGGGADIRGGRVVFDYSGGGTDPIASVRPALVSGFANNFATGQIKSSSADTHKGLGFIDDTTTSRLTVAYTYFGDADLNGTVTTADFTALSQHFNQATQNWSDGDFNYDGKVNALDFNALATNYGAVAIAAPALGSPGFGSPGLGSLVPEPASMGVLAGVFGASLMRRSRRTKN